MSAHRKLLTETVEVPEQLCVKCGGLRYLDHMLCSACRGEGQIKAASKPHDLDVLWSVVIGLIGGGLAGYVVWWVMR